MLFQFALAAGAPRGEYAMGGRFPGELPPEMRIGALVQGFLIALMASIVLARAGLLLKRWHRFSRKAVWIVVIYCAIGLFLNIITPSVKVRMIWAPLIFFNLLFSLRVALSKPPVEKTELNRSF